jgi:putative transcriptional regulator
MPRAKKKLKNRMRRNRLLNLEMTQEELGKKLGLSKAAVCAIERGRTIPSLFRAWQIAKVFGMTIEEMFYFEEEE